MIRFRFAPALLVLAGAAGLLAQDSSTAPPAGAGEEAPPAFPAEVEQVIVDLVVTDKKGNPIPGITQDDLVVTEDDVPQTIVSFEAVRLPDEPAPEPPSPPRISTNRGLASQRGRVFVVVFDDLNLSPARARDAKAAVASFLTNGVREGDYVTLIATAGGTWWTSRMESGRDQLIDIVRRLEGRRIPDTSRERMTDWEAMRIYAYGDPLVTEQVTRRFEAYGVNLVTQNPSSRTFAGDNADPLVRTRASQVYFEARVRTRLPLEVLERALNGLVSVKGRKSIILVSEGFIMDTNLDEFRRVNRASRYANAAIYFVNARGLAGMPVEFTELFGPALPGRDLGFAFTSVNMLDDGAENLADESGGFTVKNTNDLNAGIERIANESRIYYLFGYNSTNTARDGEFRKIEVRLKNGKDRTVRARKGYYAPSDTDRPALSGKLGAEPVIQAAVDSPWAESGIPLRMTQYVGGEQMLGKADVVLVAELDIGALEFEEKDGHHVAEIEFHLVVAHRETAEFYRYDQDITMSLKPSTYERLTRVWFPIERDFPLQPGDHQAKIIVREKRTGLIGSLVHEFHIPSLEEFRVSTPILSDTPRLDPQSQTLEPQPLARREFWEGGRLACQFEVFGAQKDETSMPRVAQGYEVYRPDGTVFKRLQESVINPTSLGALVRLFTFSLEGATPGNYLMLMTFRDELSGKTLQLREPFTVVPATAPAATGAAPEQPTPSS